MTEETEGRKRAELILFKEKKKNSLKLARSSTRIRNMFSSGEKV
jgi:hypothetical protein